MKRIVGFGLAILLVSACGEDSDKNGKNLVEDIVGQPGAPDAPQNLTAVAGDGMVLLAWEPSDGATSYIILRGTTAGGPYANLATSTTVAYSDTDVTNGTAYYYVVQALNAEGAGAASDEVTATPLASGGAPVDEVPDAPTDLVATAASASQITLAWEDNSNSETGFKVERKTGAGGTYAVIATLAAGAAAYTNTGLTPSTLYFYRVYAFNAAGNSATTNESSATTLAGAVQAPAFSTVHPILMASCAACHPGASPTALKLTGTGGTDHAIVAALVNTASPASSPLLQKPTMTIPHGGGKIFDVGSASYNAILAWIEGGAAK